ncbi:membrane-associated oxidoreductase [Streptomyces europaeiscabiei]|uniref:membrane-associated oxidoreductase n=1 Tax=Streptomyces europaeiscabiei TaxID=146819 RepID=UPI0029B656F1|nr:membrane-associated oxidoreductase [Streptomyces europaeiscabiei]MDX3584408.1 membrane-associated oxidoreductase [Streptomyces europaeiscabiei]MDX3619266.1 membrane-associated oxidoreductase [Streptomyces europaeiscabiei]MDX3637754.1 membrane-associated oxidoreductase [Streptomyces europaeiscabiei]MDX3653317.1 membrane-associated oxidoreductase [Streptomyces europaeiscabiei]
MEITDLTPAERRVWQAFSLGEGVDFRNGAVDDPSLGASWGPERTVRAQVLRTLLIDGPVRDGEIAGLKLTGARITGRLDLTYGTIDHPIRLRSCHFEHAPHLYGAQIRALVLSDSVLPGLSAATLRVDGVLRITGCRIAGPVRLQGAKITGAFFLNKAHLGHPATPRHAITPSTPDHEAAKEPILQLNHAEIGTDVWAVGLVVHGQVRLDAATVAGQVNLEDARLRAPGDTALQAETLSVGTHLHGLRLRTDGQVVLDGAHIPRHLNLSHAQLSNPGGEALRAASCVVGELWLHGAAPILGSVDLRRAQFDLLHVLPDVWPAQVGVDGLSYRTLAPHLPAEQRLPLLEREAGGYLPYSYEQLTTAYRAAGDDAAARTVQLAKLRRHRRTLPWYAHFWGHLQDVTVGYGFRPLRAAGWLSLLLLIGAVAFTVDHPRAVKPDEAPDFNPVVYAIDLLLPVINFGQESAFAPRGWHQWLAYLLIATGWVLATTAAAGITRSLNRQ